MLASREAGCRPGLAPASTAKHPRRLDAGRRLILGEGDRAIRRRPLWISASPLPARAVVLARANAALSELVSMKAGRLSSRLSDF
jgi:hypothetical protein